ncbi:hypothetical protein [Rathayibacter sp. VKM Ac-2630]|uniref:hypothetical protein n=1 Tax=Rathayibacter sp. VKM Ac-2630 TaxID=1938617 RepID=UPI0009811844|nr:hypothetical protein [Rathayibacter sp. VKM Ac-2630]OOB90316.1 hypothetical protein B0T42_12515 [Rathayibacter sp. VKM Ac-2630]
MTRSPIFADALDRWKEMRADFELFLENAYERAETACNGRLLNDRGRRAGVDAYSLFYGTAVRARAYASPELVEHWAKYPRMTVAEYERQWPLPERSEEAA